MPKRQPYYDMDGKNIQAQKWSDLMAQPDYATIKYTEVCIGANVVYKVVTRWTGVDHAYKGGARGPKIYETEVIGHDELGQRYTTLMGAKRGHTLVVNKLNAKLG